MPRVPYPPHDGGAVALMHMHRMLIRNPGVYYATIVMNTKRHWAEPNTLEHVFRQTKRWWVEVDNRITFVGALKNLLTSEPYHISRFRSDKVSKMLENALQEFKPDVVLAEGLAPLLYLEHCKSTLTKVIYRAHNIENRIWERMASEEKYIVKRLYLYEQARRLRMFEESVLRSREISGIITLTTNDAQGIRELGYEGPLHVSPFAIETSSYIPTYAPEGRPTVFHLGSLQWHPNRQGLEWFVKEVLPRVRQEIPSVQVVVAGYNPDGYRLPDAPGVIQLGTVADAHEFMRQHSVLVVPLRAGSGIRVKIIEAMALGKAIVSTSIGAEGIECKHGVNILLADTAEDFALCLCQCLRERGLVERLGKNARQLVEQHYSLDVVDGPLIEFLRQCAE